MKTGDHLLDQFRPLHPEPNVFRLGQYRPVSIRDQVVRACYLAERLWSVGRLEASSRLVVIGAGAAGVTVALKAIDYGVQRVTLVEARDDVLSLQARCATRWLDPVQYDWPAPYWDGDCWPITEPSGFSHPTALRITPAVHLRANFAEEWAVRFQQAVTVYESAGLLELLTGTQADTWTPRGSSYEVALRSSAGPTSQNYTIPADAIILAAGFGTDKTSVPLENGPGAYSGPSFWADDTFEAPDFGLGRAPKWGVLVSGCGDGALQDYIRLVTGKRSAREVWTTLERVIDPPVLRSFEALWAWEAQAQLKGGFAPDFASACENLHALHARYEEAVAALQRSWYWQTFVSELDKVTGARPVGKVRLAIKGRHFDTCYPLNRILVLLLAAYAAEKTPTNVLLYEQAVKAVEAAPPFVWGSGPLTAVMAHPTHCETTSQEVERWAGSVYRVQYDGIVIRHGIDASKLSPAAEKLRFQAVPAHLP